MSFYLIFLGIKPVDDFYMLIDRENLLKTTLSETMQASDYDLLKPLYVKFKNEEAIDRGGVRKELFQLLVAQLFSVEFGKKTQLSTPHFFFLLFSPFPFLSSLPFSFSSFLPFSSYYFNYIFKILSVIIKYF